MTSELSLSPQDTAWYALRSFVPFFPSSRALPERASRDSLASGGAVCGQVVAWPEALPSLAVSPSGAPCCLAAAQRFLARATFPGWSWQQPQVGQTLHKLSGFAEGIGPRACDNLLPSCLAGFEGLCWGADAPACIRLLPSGMCSAAALAKPQWSPSAKVGLARW